jgi:phosphatidylserine decarboxylase
MPPCQRVHLRFVIEHMSQDSIHFFNRYTGRIEQEHIYGEAPLRFSYQNPVGRGLLELLVKRALFSRWYGRRMDAPASRKRVAPFIQKYGLDPAEFAAPPDSYASFNEFFFRKLRPEARPIAPDPDSIVFPADGRHLGFQNVADIQGVFVKGQHFDIPALVGSEALGAKYRKGTLVLSRLCPVDYHRFHFPCAGVPNEPRLINGPLYSVNPVALRRRLAYLWENKRVLTELETPDLGTVLIIEIGATNVGSIVQTMKPGAAVTKGDEKGYFRFGGSSTVTLFEPGKVILATDLLANSAEQRELYARIGDVMGRRKN